MKFMEKRGKDALEKKDTLEVVALAYKEWKEKELFFETVEDPKLVDFAIYQMEASRLKYIYLLNKLRKKIEVEDQDEKESSLNHG